MTQTKLDTRVLDDLVKNMPKRADTATAKIAFSIEGMSKKIAPHDTYALRQSINTDKVGNASYHVQDGVHYGIYQELGFHHHSSGAFIQNPFMIPSLEHVRPKVPGIIAKELFR